MLVNFTLCPKLQKQSDMPNQIQVAGVVKVISGRTGSHAHIM
jgi:hypothetical protein